MQQRGANKAPITTEWNAQAACLAPAPFLYGSLRTYLPVAIIATVAPINALNKINRKNFFFSYSV